MQDFRTQKSSLRARAQCISFGRVTEMKGGVLLQGASATSVAMIARNQVKSILNTGAHTVQGMFNSHAQQQEAEDHTEQPRARVKTQHMELAQVCGTTSSLQAAYIRRGKYYYSNTTYVLSFSP